MYTATIHSVTRQEPRLNQACPEEAPWPTCPDWGILPYIVINLVEATTGQKCIRLQQSKLNWEQLKAKGVRFSHKIRSPEAGDYCCSCYSTPSWIQAFGPGASMNPGVWQLMIARWTLQLQTPWPELEEWENDHTSHLVPCNQESKASRLPLTPHQPEWPHTTTRAAWVPYKVSDFNMSLPNKIRVL